MLPNWREIFSLKLVSMYMQSLNLLPTFLLLFRREKRRRKRSLKSTNFTQDDVIIPVDPKQLGANLHVELAVLKILADGTTAVVSSDNLSKIILQAESNISDLLGGRLVSAQPKVPAQTTQQPHSKTATMPITLSPTTRKQASPGRVAASEGGSNDASVIGGVVVAVVVVVAIIAFLVWYFR